MLPRMLVPCLLSVVALSQCRRASDDVALESWNAESVAMTVAACKAGASRGLPEGEATRGCECIVAEMQKRWATPRAYDEDTAKHNQELADAGVLERCRPQPSSSPSPAS